MSGTTRYQRIVNRLATLADYIDTQTNGRVTLGYRIANDDEQSDPLALAEYDREGKRAWRERLRRLRDAGQTWAADELTAAPPDAGDDGSGVHVLVELHVRGSRARRLGWFTPAQIAGMTDPQARTALRALATEAIARADGGGG